MIKSIHRSTNEVTSYSLQAILPKKSSSQGLAALTESTMTEAQPNSQSTQSLFHPPSLLDYSCIQLVDDFSKSIKDIVLLVKDFLKTIYATMQDHLQEKTELLQDLLKRSKETSLSSSVQNATSCFLAACNLIFGGFLLQSGVEAAQIPGICFMAASFLSTAGVAIKQAGGWDYAAKLFAKDNKELEMQIKTYSPLIPIILSLAVSAAGGSTASLDPSLFTGFMASHPAMAFSHSLTNNFHNLSTATVAYTNARHKWTESSLSSVQENISQGTRSQTEMASFVGDLKESLDTGYKTLKQIIQHSIQKKVI